MELNIIKAIKELRNQLKRKPKRIVVKLPDIKLKETKPSKPAKPKREPMRIEIEGVCLSLKEIAEKYNLQVKTVEARYRVGNRGRLLIRPSQKTYKRTPKDDLTNIV